MKILAIEREIDHIKWENQSQILKEEALAVYKLQQQGIIREIYFTNKKNAIIVLECSNLNWRRIF